MTANQIQAFVVAAPQDSPYFELAFRRLPLQRPRCLAERLGVALADPALGWNVAQSYAAANLPLPPLGWPPSISRAYQFLIDPEGIDENLSLAQELQGPERWSERDLIRALLMCEDANEQIIAELFGFEPEVVTLFDELWWDVRSRSNELLYMAQLLNGRRSGNEPQGEQAPGELGMKLIRIGRITGKIRAVLVAAGLAGPNEQTSEQGLLEQIEQTVLIEAVVRQQMGLVGKKENPALALVEKYLLGLPETVEDSSFADPLLALSMNKQAQFVFKKHMQQQLAEQLQAGRLQAKEKAHGRPPAGEYEI